MVSTLDVLLEQGTWRPEQRGDLEAYVHACRLARFHREEAEKAPYAVHAEIGRTFMHPGFGAARDAQREQRALADALVLTPAARKAQGVNPDGENDPFSDLDPPDDGITRLAEQRAERLVRMRFNGGRDDAITPSPDLRDDLDGGDLWP